MNTMRGSEETVQKNVHHLPCVLYLTMKVLGRDPHPHLTFKALLVWALLTLQPCVFTSLTVILLLGLSTCCTCFLVNCLPGEVCGWPLLPLAVSLLQFLLALRLRLQSCPRWTPPQGVTVLGDGAPAGLPQVSLIWMAPFTYSSDLC